MYLRIKFPKVLLVNFSLKFLLDFLELFKAGNLTFPTM